MVSPTDLVLTISPELKKNDPRWWGMIPRDPGLLVTLEASPDVGEPSLMIISRPRLEKRDIPGRLTRSWSSTAPSLCQLSEVGHPRSEPNS